MNYDSMCKQRSCAVSIIVRRRRRRRILILILIIFLARRQPHPQAAFRLGLSKTIKSINGFVEDSAPFDRVPPYGGLR